MSSRRKSTRANNYSNVQEQQKHDKIQKRQAVQGATAAGAAQQLHSVLTEAMLQPVWQVYEKYAAASPLLERYSEDGGARSNAEGARRSERRRAARSPAGAGEGGEDSAAIAEALAPMEAAQAAEAARSLEESGHHCLDLLEPLLAGNVTLDRRMQEALMHMVLNAASHRTHLSTRALALLERLLQAHPPVKQDGDTLAVNTNLWEPVSGKWQSTPLDGLPRLTSLKELHGLTRLVGGAHNAVAGAVEAATRASLPRPSIKDCAECGEVGQLLLLRYWVAILQADFDVRLAAARRLRRAQLAAGLPGAVADRAAREVLDSSLVLQLMRTADLNTKWRYETDAKPALVRLLAATTTYAHIAARQGAELPLPGSAASPSASAAAAAAAAPSSGLPPSSASSASASSALLVVGPAEVGSLAGRLLRLLCEAYGWMERLDAYVREGQLVVDNDRVELDKRLVKAVHKEAAFKAPEHLQALLHALPAASAVRLLAHLLAEEASGAERLAGEAAEGGGCLQLQRLADHYMDGGVQDSPPQVLASPPLRFLLDEGAGQGQGGHWGWALRSFKFNGDLPARTSLPLLLAALATAGIQHAQQEQAAAAEQEQQDGGGSSGGAEGEEGQESNGVMDAAAWGAEAAAVAGLYQRASERLEAEGVVGGVAAAAADGGGAGSLCAVIAKRCADNLARRAAAAAAAGLAA